MKILVENRGGGGDLNKPVVLPVENRGGREGVWSCFPGGKIKRTRGISLWSLICPLLDKLSKFRSTPQLLRIRLETLIDWSLLCFKGGQEGVPNSAAQKLNVPAHGDFTQKVPAEVLLIALCLTIH